MLKGKKETPVDYKDKLANVGMYLMCLSLSVCLNCKWNEVLGPSACSNICSDGIVKASNIYCSGLRNLVK